MAIVAYLGDNVKDYCKNTREKIEELELCCKNHPKTPLAFHSTYQRGIKETGEVVTIHVMICHECAKASKSDSKKGCTVAILPDFLSPHKHFGADEIETVVFQNDEDTPVNDIDTAASPYTVNRWLKEFGEKIGGWISNLKYIAIERDCVVSECALKELSAVESLKILLEALPRIKSCGNLLSRALLWWQTRSSPLSLSV